MRPPTKGYTMITFEEIQNMSPEEVDATNRKLMLLIAGQFALVIGAKVAVYFAVRHYSRKFLTSNKKI